MIFVANVLLMNGGTTFLIRTCREFSNRGTKCAVILLRSEYDVKLLLDLEKYATVIRLDQYLFDKGKIFRSYLSVFAFVNWIKLESALAPFSGQIHVMGIFGLIFALRLSGRKMGDRVTVGVYHQNEFMYHSPPFFFAQEARRLFSSIPASNVVFFNDATQKNYETFFKNQYSDATVVPIGIDLRQIEFNQTTIDPWRIVSVGNLVNFKTYNEHIIRLIAKLQYKYPNIYYEIYGDGPEKANLLKLAVNLGVNDRVHFMGVLPYSEFEKAVISAKLFVGSGTSLIEAAALGVPAMVGIESLKLPETYGFLSDVKGFSYNENIPGISKQLMLPLVESIFGEPDFYASVSQACIKKSSEFSVARTVDGFLALDQTAKPIQVKVSSYNLYRMMVSLVALGVFARLGFIASFGDRRDQSY